MKRSVGGGSDEDVPRKRPHVTGDAHASKTRQDDVPLAVVHVDPQDCPGVDPSHQKSATGSFLLDQCLHPMPRKEFLRNIFQQCACAFTGGNPERFSEVIGAHMFGLDLRSMLENSASEDISVWMRDQETGLIESFKTDDPHVALACHHGGGSLYFRSSQEMADRFVVAMARDLGMNFGCLQPTGEPQGEIETFVSRKGHVTDWHYDFQENFTMQLRGSKRWHFRKSGVTRPIRGFTPHFRSSSEIVEMQVKAARLDGTHFEYSVDASPFQTVDSVLLQEGDILYFPAGLMHKVECTDDSISINISLVGTRWADFMGDAVRQMLLGIPSMRDFVMGQSSEELLQECTVRLQSFRALLASKTVNHPLQLAGHLLPGALLLPNPPERIKRSKSIALLEALTLALKRVSPDRLECAFVANPLTCCFPQGEGGAKLSSNSDVEGAPEDVDSELGGMSSEDECTDEEKEEEEEDVEMSSLDSSLGQNVEEKQAWIQPLLLPFEDLCQESASQQVFVVHHNFGNEDLESDFHLRFVVPVELSAAVECCCASAPLSEALLTQDVRPSVQKVWPRKNVEQSCLFAFLHALSYVGIVTASC